MTRQNGAGKRMPKKRIKGVKWCFLQMFRQNDIYIRKSPIFAGNQIFSFHIFGNWYVLVARQMRYDMPEKRIKGMKYGILFIVVSNMKSVPAEVRNDRMWWEGCTNAHLCAANFGHPL